tara:strand:+ start:39 stop:1634 length:1596 start_codon:yes stop_codon:yes gene_type:complete
MDMGSLIPIILTAVIIVGFLTYYYFNNKDSSNTNVLKQSNNQTQILGVVERYWKPIDVNHINKVIDPKGAGKREGAIDYPSDEESGGKLSPIEDAITTEVKEHYKNEISRISDFHVLGTKRRLEQQFRIDKRNMESNGYEQTFQSMKGEWANEKDSFLQRVQAAIRARDIAKKKLRAFKLDNQIAVGREPINTSKFATFIKILIPLTLFSLEIYLNYGALMSSQFIVADQASYISFIVGSINVVLSFLVGYLVLTHLINPVDATKKPRVLFYGPILAAYGFALIYVNCMMGVFRSAMTNINQMPSGMRRDAFNEASTDALMPFDNLGDLNFDGGLLLFLGAFFAVVTLIDAYFFKDPIPGYSKVGNNLAAAEWKIVKLTDVDRELFSKKQYMHIHNLNMKNKSREDSVASWEYYADALQQIKDLHKKFNDDMKEVLVTSIGNYRTKNRQFRHTKAPEYFKEPVETSFVKDFGYTYSHLVDELVDDPEIKRKGKEARSEISNEFSMMQQKYQMFFDKERLELNEIVRGFDNE